VVRTTCPKQHPPGGRAHLQGTAAPVAEEQDSYATSAGRQGGAHSAAADESTIEVVLHLQLRPGVEPVPALGGEQGGRAGRLEKRHFM